MLPSHLVESHLGWNPERRQSKSAVKQNTAQVGHKGVNPLTTVGWSLEAAPFMGPAPQFPDNQDLLPFSFTHNNSCAIDLSLDKLDDPGLLADIDHHHGLIAEEATL